MVGRSVAWDISVRLGWLSRDEAPWRRSRSLTYHPHGCDRQPQYYAHGQSRLSFPPFPPLPPAVLHFPVPPSSFSRLTLERATPDCTSVPAVACQVACLPACLRTKSSLTLQSLYIYGIPAAPPTFHRLSLLFLVLPRGTNPHIDRGTNPLCGRRWYG